MSLSYYSDTLAALAAESRLRRLPDGDSAAFATRLVDLSSNDYLGLAARSDLQREFLSGLSTEGLPPMSSVASRLLAGRQAEHQALEELLSELYDRPVLTAASGYHANVGQVSALCSAPSTLIVADRLVHASIIDGIRLSGAPFERFRHNDAGHLEQILRRRGGDFRRVWVVTESVFSMDGDTAPLAEIASLKQRYDNVLIYVDEAHAFGVEGRRGLGVCRSLDCYDSFDVVVGTLGKAAASMGAFAALSDELRQYLVNSSRAHIFSTALPPLQAAWSRFIIEKIITMDAERVRLKSLGQRLSSHLAQLGAPSQPSHIQPFIVGSPERAVALSEALRKEGFKVLPIRVPTVPPHTDRLRISLSAALTPDIIDLFGDTLKRLIK